MTNDSIGEDDLLPLSALQHLRFCERQCALIHLEQIWTENRLTVEGQQMHERVHAGGHETRRDIRIEFGVRLRSSVLGLAGIADVVEFHADLDMSGARRWIPFPVEYKHGKQKTDSTDLVQLCAQAVALEEMTGESVTHGSIYYGKERRRIDVNFTQKIRDETSDLAFRLHELLHKRVMPPPVNDSRCVNCSLNERCMPGTVGNRQAVRRWFERMVTSGDD